jgi:hypothetical protein
MEKLIQIKTKEDIDTLLKGYIVVLAFKKKNGERREMTATLNPNLLPEPPVKKPGAKSYTPNPDMVRLYDLENDGWRSFHPDQLLEIISATAADPT